MEANGTGLRFGIIGGGLAGLTAAYELARRGHRVRVFERDAELGGQAGTFQLGGERVERFYHHLFTSDADILDLISELGLADRMEWPASRMGIFCQGTVHPFGSPADLLRFSPLSPIDRLRFGLAVLYLQRQRDWKRFESVTAADWVRRHVGRRVFDVVWGPLLRGKFGDKAEQVSMTWLWGKVHLRGKSRSRTMQEERLGYMRGSFQLLADALADAIAGLGGEVFCSASVKRVAVQQNRVTGLEMDDRASRGPWPAGRIVPCDVVIATIPSFAFAALAPELPEEYLRKLAAVEYQSALCLVLEMKRQLTDIYWLNISDPSIPFVGAIEHTNYIPAERYSGKRVLYLSNYLDRSHPLYSASVDDVLEQYVPHLRKLNPEFQRDWIGRHWGFREDAGQPIVVRGYSNLIPAHATPVAGLYLANTTQIYPEDRGMNYSVRLGKRIAALAHEQARAGGQQFP